MKACEAKMSGSVLQLILLRIHSILALLQLYFSQVLIKCSSPSPHVPPSVQLSVPAAAESFLTDSVVEGDTAQDLFYAVSALTNLGKKCMNECVCACVCMDVCFLCGLLCSVVLVGRWECQLLCTDQLFYILDWSQL